MKMYSIKNTSVLDPLLSLILLTNILRDKMEVDFELYTIEELHEAIGNLDKEIYFSEMTKIKLKPICFCQITATP